LGNFYAITKREYFVHYDDLRQPKDKDEWGFSPAEVNAFYDPETNQICMIININILH
jgi:predicted metalloendopeptidase